MTPKNVAASVRQRLLNRARGDQRPLAELLQYFAMERFLYRLSQSEHAQRFILKGALMLRVWQASELRPTKDIDMLGQTANDEAAVIAQIKDVLESPVAPDGLSFDVGSIQSERITEEASYQGIRIRFRGTLDTARINMQIDIGFGDIVHPEPKASVLPTMLDFEAPRLLCYSRESAIAEKFEAMVKLGALNSRMKDFYDIWLLSRQFDFEGSLLKKAVQLTFEQRGTNPHDEIVALKPTFAAEKQAQWAAFCRRLNQEPLPRNFADITAQVAFFLDPVVGAVRAGQPLNKDWHAASGWR